MNLSPRDRRALAWLAVAAVVGLAAYFWPASEGAAAVVAPLGDPVTLAETRLARLRETAATVPAKEEVTRKFPPTWRRAKKACCRRIPARRHRRS